MQNNGKNVLSNLPDRMMHRNFKYQGCTQQSVHRKWLDSLRARQMAGLFACTFLGLVLPRDSFPFPVRFPASRTPKRPTLPRACGAGC